MKVFLKFLGLGIGLGLVVVCSSGYFGQNEIDAYLEKSIKDGLPIGLKFGNITDNSVRPIAYSKDYIKFRSSDSLVIGYVFRDKIEILKFSPAVEK